MSTYTIRHGSTGRVLMLQALRIEGGPAMGLLHDSPGATAAFVREGEPPVSVALAPGSREHHVPGGFLEIDRALLPGVYAFGAPDQLLAPGSPHAVLMIRFDEALIETVEIELVAFDPLDPVRLGMDSLSPEWRVRALQGAFPKLAAEEMEGQVPLSPDR
ncbi:MAG TPA: hypothetical protein VF986_03510 [Actinomycetota bacterium]